MLNCFTRFVQEFTRSLIHHFSIRLGSIDLVILNDFESTKEAFLQDALIARPVDDLFQLNKETIGKFISF